MSSALYTIGTWVGITGFFSLGLLIFSGDTARWWDRFWGLDRIIKFQRKFSFFVAIWILLHPVFFMLSRKTVWYYLIPDLSVLPLALGIVSLYVFVVVMISSQVYKRISYDMWQYIHILTYVLFFSTLYHAIYWGSDVDILMPYYLFMTFLVGVGIAYRTYYKIRERANVYIVERISPETHNSFTLDIATKKPFSFSAGQFCFLRLDRDNLHARHPFTIASAPGEPLRFTIKEAGRFTRVLKSLPPGSPINVDGPFGIFIPPDKGKLVLIAGGVGITPFMSVLRDRIRRNIQQPTTLLYGVKTDQDIIFQQEIDAMHEPWFSKVYVLENPSEKAPTHDRGHITKKTIATHVSDIGNSLFYICGPEKMKRSVQKNLSVLGVPRKHIFVEEFFW